MASERLLVALVLGALGAPCVACAPSSEGDGTQDTDADREPKADPEPGGDPDPGAAPDPGESPEPDGDDSFSIPRDTWARLDVLANDGLGDMEASVRVVEAPTRGVVVAEEDGRCRYRSDWHADGTDRFTYAVLEEGVERARYHVDIEVRDELWLAAGARVYRAHLDVGGAPTEQDLPSDWETLLRDVSDDGPWFVGDRVRGGQARGFWTDSEQNVGELVVGEQATFARRVLGSDLLGGALRDDGTTEGLRAARDGTVLERWEVPGALATWPLGVLDGSVVARIEQPVGSAGALLSRSTDGEVLVDALDLENGSPTSISGDRLAGERTQDNRIVGFVSNDSGELDVVDLADAVEVRVEDVEASGYAVGRVSRGGPFGSSFLRTPAGVVEEFAIRTVLETSAFGLSPRGDIVGGVRDVAGYRRSFWLEPVTDPDVAALELTPVEEPPHPGIDHACFHTRLGPFDAVQASPTVEEAAEVALRAGHVMYTATLGGGLGYVAIASLKPGEQIALFLETRSVVVRTLDVQGRYVAAEFAERTDTCENIGFFLQVRTPASGPLILALETEAPSVTFVLERSWVYRG